MSAAFVRPRSKKDRPLSPTQLRLLHNIANDLHTMTGVVGAAAHGGFQQTISSVQKRGLVKLERLLDREESERLGSRHFKSIYTLTVKGAEEHALNCCNRGLTVEGAKIRLLEAQMEGSNDESFFGDHFD